MNTLLKRLLVFMCIMALASLAGCNLIGLLTSTEEPEPSGLIAVNVSSSKSGLQYVNVAYYWAKDNANFQITCFYPDPEGKQNNKIDLPLSHTLSHEAGQAAFSFNLTKHGDYSVNCIDSIGHDESSYFTVTADQPDSENFPEANDPQVESNPPDSPAGSFTLPKYGQYKSAGMWMLFDEAIVNPKGNSVPRHCLPGVNYTHVGGVSHLDVAADGTLTGSCQFTQNNTEYTGNLTFGKWFQADGMIEFNLETKVVSSAIDGTGTTTTTATWRGSGSFTKQDQASGSADWSYSCTTTNDKSATCPLELSGTIPWQINFNPLK